MRKKIAIFLLFIISAIPVFSADINVYGLVGAGQSAVFSKKNEFDLKAQPETSVDFSFILDFKKRAGLDSTFSLYFVQDSSLSGGYYYRGYTGASLSLSLFASTGFRHINHNLHMRTKLGIGPSIHSSKLKDTELLFVYPGVLARVSTDLKFRSLQYLIFGIDVPLSYYIRRDLDRSFGIGLMLRIGLTSLSLR